MSDLFGSDVPTIVDGQPSFVWNDGPVLRAVKKGEWVLLDEVGVSCLCLTAIVHLHR